MQIIGYRLLPRSVDGYETHKTQYRFFDYRHVFIYLIIGNKGRKKMKIEEIVLNRGAFTFGEGFAVQIAAC
jgi:hypothetical protein